MLTVLRTTFVKDFDLYPTLSISHEKHYCKKFWVIGAKIQKILHSFHTSIPLSEILILFFVFPNYVHLMIFSETLKIHTQHSYPNIRELDMVSA